MTGAPAASASKSHACSRTPSLVSNQCSEGTVIHCCAFQRPTGYRSGKNMPVRRRYWENRPIATDRTSRNVRTRIATVSRGELLPVAFRRVLGQRQPTVGTDEDRIFHVADVSAADFAERIFQRGIEAADQSS